MEQPTKSRLRYGRAVILFLLAYIAVTVLGIALSVSIGIVKHVPDSGAAMQNAAYLLSERFFPAMNLLVWMAFSWGYFRKPANSAERRRESVWLGAFWLALAVAVDFVGFVLIQNPISLSPHDFYIGQFPWIYLIYIAIFLSPLCFVMLSRGVNKKVLA